MGLGKTLLRSLEEEARALDVTPAQCLRSRPIGGDTQPCVACVEVCPHQAIALDELEVDADRCDGCGACAEACPTSALDHASSARRDAFRALAAVREGEPFRVACPLAEGQDTAPLKVACLAGLPWELPALLALRGASCVELCSGKCGSCARASLEARVEEVATAAANVARALEANPIVRVRPAVEGEHGEHPEAERRTGRRGLFTGLLKRGRSVAERAGAATMDRAAASLASTPEEIESLDPLWLRRLLVNSVKAQDTHTELALPRAGRPVVDADACIPCPLCQASCQPGALSLTAATRASSLELDAASCTGCGACVGACPEHAMLVEPTIDLALWGRTQTLAHRAADDCQHCGQPALSAQLPYCARCYREGHAAGHLPR